MINISESVKECIKENKDDMEKQELMDIYINENKDYVSVVFILKACSEIDYNYWGCIIKIVSECGTEYVSCYHENYPLLKLSVYYNKFFI